MATIATMQDDWTPAKLAAHQAWRRRMFAAVKHEPQPILDDKPDLLAAKIEVVADPEKAAMEQKIQAMEELVGKMHEQLQWMRQKRSISFENMPTDKIVRLQDIIAVVARFYNRTINDMKSARRTADIVRPRQVAMYLCRELTARSTPEIGRHLGGKDHTTVLHGCRKIEELIKTDPFLCQEVAELERLFA